MKKQTFISIHGGLGNQLFQLALAESLTAKTEVSILPWKKHCRLDSDGKMWINQYELSKKFIKKLTVSDYFFIFYSRFCHSLLVHIPSLSLVKVPLSALHKALVKIPNLFGIGIITTLEIGEFEYPNLLRKNYIVSYFQTHKAFNFIGKTIAAENKTFFPELQKLKALNSQILVLHIRRTDYKNNPDIGLLNAKYYAEALELISTRFEWRELWLFSDDLDEAVELVPLEYHDKVRRMKSENLTPVEVLAQMSIGDAYILSNSTFGWWAANLNEQVSTIVVVPQSWFKNLPEPKGLIPSDWIRL